MLEIVRAFVDICLFRRGPQDLPASSFLLYSTLGAYAASGYLLSLVIYPAATSALASLTDTTLLVVLTLSLLYLNGLIGRAQQTLAALAGTGTLLAILALVPSYWFSWLSTHRETDALTRPVSELLELVVWSLVVWSLVVMGHIIRHALSTRWIVGLIVAVIFFSVAISVQRALLPLST